MCIFSKTLSVDDKDRGEDKVLTRVVKTKLFTLLRLLLKFLGTYTPSSSLLEGKMDKKKKAVV